jgi:hypothetical protein
VFKILEIFCEPHWRILSMSEVLVGAKRIHQREYYLENTPKIKHSKFI